MHSADDDHATLCAYYARGEEQQRHPILHTARAVESVPEVIGASPHLRARRRPPPTRAQPAISRS